jgi:hypothetical protein
VNDTTRLERGDRSDMDSEVLALSLSRLSTDPSFDDFTTPPVAMRADLLEPGGEFSAAERDAHARRY